MNRYRPLLRPKSALLGAVTLYESGEISYGEFLNRVVQIFPPPPPPVDAPWLPSVDAENERVEALVDNFRENYREPAPLPVVMKT